MGEVQSSVTWEGRWMGAGEVEEVGEVDRGGGVGESKAS